MFVANAVTPRGALQDYSFTTGTTHGKPVTIVIPFVGVGSTINPLAPDSMRSFVKVLADIVLGGPRLMAVAMGMLAGSQRLDGMDVAGCAAVLAFLAERDGPVPFPEIAAAIPEGHDVVAVLTQVQKLEGVRLVTSEPAGLSLFSDLRAELPKGKRRRSGKAEGLAPKPDVPVDDDSKEWLVLLLREPRDLDAELLTRIVNATFGLNLATAGSECTEFVTGEGTMFMAQFQSRIFMIQTLGPFFEDALAVARDLGELRLQKAVTEHQASLSVTSMQGYADADSREPYWYIAKLTAALAPGTRWPCSGPRGQIRLWEGAVKEKLAQGDPEAAFAVSPEKVPVPVVGADDPEMKAAEAEARRRWPEFLAAFARRQPGQTFAVKVPIRDGDSIEFLWLTVLGVENDVISGKVDNEPVQLTNVKLGSRVRLKRQVLNDWLYTDGGKMVGGFTVKVLQARQGS